MEEYIELYYLILVIEMCIRQFPCHELVEHDPVRVHVGAEGVWRGLLHADDLGGHPQDRARRLLPLDTARCRRVWNTIMFQ